MSRDDPDRGHESDRRPRRRTGTEAVFGALIGGGVGAAIAVATIVALLATNPAGGQGGAGLEAIAGIAFWSVILGGIGGVIGLAAGQIVRSQREPARRHH
jgi:hypothetical protein